MNNVSLGDTSAFSGSTDLGSNVSIASGTDERGNPDRLVLMEIQEELWLEDQAALQERSDKVVAALNAGATGGQEARDGRELNLRYVGSRTTLPAMFQKKSPR